MARLRLVTLGIVAALAAACGPTGASSAPTGGTATGAPTQGATPAPTEDACVTADLPLKEAGKLTIGTNNPAFPPYFEGTEGGNTEPWDPEWGDPTSGKGFESAVAYAIAEQLGLTRDAVEWIVVASFEESFAPGPKDFDFFIAQVTYNDDRAENADLSEGYYFGNQTVVTMQDNEFATATTLSELRGATLGAQIGTTSLATIEDVIGATAEVFNTTDDAIEDMQNGDIDGVVVDLPTAGFITTVQVEGSKIVGQIGLSAGAQPEHFSVVLEKDSGLTGCVNQAITALRDDGTLDVLSDEWLPFNSAPELQP